MKESDYKRLLLKRHTEAGGWGRRIEDQFSVGMPDMVLAFPSEYRTIFLEAKIVRSRTFGVTPRQLVELNRINGLTNPGALGLMIGFHPDSGMHYLAWPSIQVTLDMCTKSPSYFDALNSIRTYGHVQIS